MGELSQTVCKLTHRSTKNSCKAFLFYLKRNQPPSTFHSSPSIHFRMCFKGGLTSERSHGGHLKDGKQQTTTSDSRLIFHPNCQSPLSGCRGGQNVWHSWLPANSLSPSASIFLTPFSPALMKFFLACRCHGEGIICQTCFHLLLCNLGRKRHEEKGGWRWQMGIEGVWGESLMMTSDLGYTHRQI